MKLDDDDSRLLHISWRSINRGSNAIAAHISHHELPAVIVSTQEDAIIASLVCNIIELPLCIVHLNDRQNGIILDCIPKFGKPIRSGVYDQPPMPSVAIISTLVDNNRNVFDLSSYYKNRDHKVKTLCAYSWLDIDNLPDYSWVKLTKFSRVTLPWEKK